MRTEPDAGGRAATAVAPASPEAHIDPGAYLRRIGHDGSVRPDFATLAAIHRLHSRAIPFEGLNPWLGLPVKLDAASLQAKLVDGGRGGYCYEHNLLLADVLGGIGFEVTTLAARVLWNAPPDAVKPRTHMLLRIDLDGQAWLVDGGFGGMTLTSPLLLRSRDAQATPHERFRLVDGEHDVIMQAEVQGEWRTTYRFDLSPHNQADYELASWFLCHHPESHFRQHLIVAQTREDGRDALEDNRLARHFRDGRSDKTVLRSSAELRDALEQVFGLHLPDVPHIGERFAELVASAP